MHLMIHEYQTHTHDNIGGLCI